MMSNFIIQLLIILGVVLTGYVSSKCNLWHTDMNRMMSRFVLNVSCPLIILASVMGKGVKYESSELMQLAYVSLILYAVLFVGAYLFSAVFRFKPHEIGFVRFSVMFGNVTFIGFPVVTALYGAKSVFYAAVLTIPFNLLMFSFGVLFVKGQGKVSELLQRKILFSPCIVASVLAFAIAATGLPFPEPVGVFCHLIGDMTIPCALLLVGSALATISLRDMVGNPCVFKAVFLRLLLAPALVVCILEFVPCSSLVRNVAVILSGMPMAANGIMLCLQYNRSSREMAQGIFLSTLCSVVTIPLLVCLIDFVYA